MLIVGGLTSKTSSCSSRCMSSNSFLELLFCPQIKRGVENSTFFVELSVSSCSESVLSWDEIAESISDLLLQSNGCMMLSESCDESRDLVPAYLQSRG